MENIISTIRQILLANKDEKTRQASLRFFKEPVNIYGLKSAFVAKLAKEQFKKIKNQPKATVFDLCEELWQSGYMEESFIACNWAYAMRKSFEPKDFDVFEHWIDQYVRNWASCDTLCNHTIGTFVEMYPQNINNLKAWTHSNNLWKRRAAAVSLIVPAKKGLFIPEVFEIATTLLMDREDLVQKGYGWMLKVASQSSDQNQQQVFEFILCHKAVMPRTALRYAIEKMPAEMKKEAMLK